MRLSRLAALPLIVLLSGCPSLFGATGNTELNPRVLAVTQLTDTNAEIHTAYLEWQTITNATRYQLIRTIGTTSQHLEKTEKTHFSEQIGKDSITYKVVALDAGDNEKTTSAPLTVQALASEVAAPTKIHVDGKEALEGYTTKVTGMPSITWTAAEKATHYYVKVYNKSNKTVFAAFTKDTQATVGKLVWEDIKLPNYPQVKDQSLPVKETVYVTVAAIRANDPDLKVATAFDIKTSAVSEVERQ